MGTTRRTHLYLAAIHHLRFASSKACGLYAFVASLDRGSSVLQHSSLHQSASVALGSSSSHKRITHDQRTHRVREISESLTSIGDHVPLRNLIEIVLDALPEEYDSIIAAVNSKEEVSSLEELESSLLAHESRLEKHRKAVITEPATANLTQAASPSASVLVDQTTTDAFP